MWRAPQGDSWGKGGEEEGAALLPCQGLLQLGKGSEWTAHGAAALQGSSELVLSTELFPFHQKMSLLSPQTLHSQQQIGRLLCLIVRLEPLSVAQGRSLAKRGYVQSLLVQQEILYSALDILLPLSLSGGFGCLLESCLLTGNQNCSFHTKTIVLQAINYNQ